VKLGTRRCSAPGDAWRPVIPGTGDSGHRWFRAPGGQGRARSLRYRMWPTSPWPGGPPTVAPAGRIRRSNRPEPPWA